MEVIRTDEPDIDGEILEPVYRVHFWSISEDPSVAPNLSAWRIKGAADVHEAIDWANNECGGRAYELFLEWIDHAQSRDGGGCRWSVFPGSREEIQRKMRILQPSYSQSMTRPYWRGRL